MVAPIGDLALVHRQHAMPGNLLVDCVRPMWAAVGPSEDMLPNERLCPTTGCTLWAKGAHQLAKVAGVYHQLLALGDGSCVPVPTIVLRVCRNVAQRVLKQVLGGRQARV